MTLREKQIARILIQEVNKGNYCYAFHYLENCDENFEPKKVLLPILYVLIGVKEVESLKNLEEISIEWQILLNKLPSFL